MVIDVPLASSLRLWVTWGQGRIRRKGGRVAPYLLGKSFFENEIKASVKSGNYLADTSAAPYQSLLSYKARALNGIWATAPAIKGEQPELLTEAERWDWVEYIKTL